jgi:Ser/Thr protein kinase RdoA (MazF antagonist)
VNVQQIAARFKLAGRLRSIAPFHGGHINNSYLLACDDGGAIRRYLLQRINPAVFPRPVQIMENIQRVTDHLRRRLAARGTASEEIARRVLTLVPAEDDAWFTMGADGTVWRMYLFIEATCVLTEVRSPADAATAGRAFGEFQRELADYHGPRLQETIPDFHNTPLRLAALEKAVAADAHGRAADTRAEIDFALSRRTLARILVDLLASGAIPERIVHNDAKISNVLFDETTAEALCVTDLDTVMPGTPLFDFGDMVRSMTCTAAEDETDLARIAVDPALFEALVRGYLSAATFLNAVEREHLLAAGQVITFEQGLRFLTDYLRGDVYYRVIRPKQNLDRCRTQFALLDSLERMAPELRRLVAAAARAASG